MAKFSEKQVAKQSLSQFHITQAIPNAQEGRAQQSQQRIAGTTSLAGVNSNQQMFEFGPVQHCLRPVQALQAEVLKVGAGYEKFGLGGKWLLNGTSLAKFGRIGNPVVMQRSQLSNCIKLYLDYIGTNNLLTENFTKGLQ